jgi:hypothetical protein
MVSMPSRTAPAAIVELFLRYLVGCDEGCCTYVDDAKLVWAVAENVQQTNKQTNRRYDETHVPEEVRNPRLAGAQLMTKRPYWLGWAGPLCFDQVIVFG